MNAHPLVAYFAQARRWQPAIDAGMGQRVRPPSRIANRRSPRNSVDCCRPSPADSGARSMAPAARFGAAMELGATRRDAVTVRGGLQSRGLDRVVDDQPSVAIHNEGRYIGATT